MAVSIMLVGTLAFQFFPRLLLGMFNASENMMAIGVPALKIISLHFVLAGFSIVSLSTFQALGHGVISLIVSFLRQLVLLLPAAYVLSHSFGLNAIWWAFPFAEIGAVACSALMLRRVYLRQIKPLNP